MATTSGQTGAPPSAPVRRPSRGILNVRRVGIFATLLALVLATAAGLGCWRVRSALHASYPQTTGTLRIAGLGGAVTVDRDANGIAQIYAASSADLFLAEGYVQSQDRFWQMDVSRHYAAGTLASMLGQDYLAHDELARTLGWHTLAAQSYDKLQPQTRGFLRAYAQGVNDYLDRKSVV